MPCSWATAKPSGGMPVAGFLLHAAARRAPGPGIPNGLHADSQRGTADQAHRAGRSPCARRRPSVTGSSRYRRDPLSTVRAAAGHAAPPPPPGARNPDTTRIAEPHFVLGRMRIHVHPGRVHVEVQHIGWPAVPVEHVPVAARTAPASNLSRIARPFRNRCCRSGWLRACVGRMQSSPAASGPSHRARRTARVG